MTLFVWVLFGLVVFAEGFRVKNEKTINPEVLEWPTDYRLIASRTVFPANVTDYYEIWKTCQRSRIDFNNGFAKSIVDTNKKVAANGVKYYIYTEATEGQDAQTVCNYIEGSIFEQLTPETLLPDANNFKKEGVDNFYGKIYTRFSNNVNTLGVYSKSLFWAYFDTDKWIPTRYEIKEFDSLLGEKSRHEVWDYSDYEIETSSDLVFNVDEYSCTEQYLESEDVTEPII